MMIKSLCHSILFSALLFSSLVRADFSTEGASWPDLSGVQSGDIILESGHFETESPVCAYNVSYFTNGDDAGYEAEAADSRKIDCRDAGAVLTFSRIGVNQYRIIFDGAGIAYEWHVRSSEVFLEKVLKRDSSDRWVQIRQILYRHRPEGSSY